MTQILEKKSITNTNSIINMVPIDLQLSKTSRENFRIISSLRLQNNSKIQT